MKENFMDTNRRTDYATLVLRLSLGMIFVAHGLLKITVFSLPGTVAFFVSVGLPGWLAYPVAFGEIIGGALLLGGIYTSYVVVGLLPILIGAAVVHSGNGWVFSNANGGWEYTAFLIAASVALALLSDGAFAWKPRRRTQN
jgi:putative oxidoreductase